jgi:heparan-alpha-glucosaminide N-acetyltransferase
MIAGMNSIVLYMCHSVFSGYFPVSWQMPDMTMHWQLLLLHLWGTTFWAIVAYWLYRKKVFIAL